MPTEPRAGFATSWTTYGQGDRPALMLHCSLGQASAWKGVAKALNNSLHMVAMDLPGHGASDIWDDGADYKKTCVDTAATFLDQKMDIIGHSFGAAVALRLAQENPDRVRSLTLIEPVFFAVAFAGDDTARATYDQDHDPFFHAYQSGDLARATELFTTLWGGSDWSRIPAPVQKYMVDRINIVAATNESLLNDNAGLAEQGKLENILCPTLIVEAENTVAIMRNIAAELERRIPDAKRVIIKGSAHMVPMSHANELSMHIAEVLANS